MELAVVGELLVFAVVFYAVDSGGVVCHFGLRLPYLD